jgi:hypothetical protein
MRNLTLEAAKKAADSPKNANLEVVVVEDDNGGYAVLTRSYSWGRRGDYKERIYANGAKLDSPKGINFSDDTDKWYDDLIDDSQKISDFKKERLNEITNREATEANLKKLEVSIRTSDFITPTAQAYILGQIRHIRANDYKNQFRYQYGGKRVGGGKKSAASEFFSMIYQAINYMAANGAKLKSGKLTLSQLKSMIEEYNSQGRNFELLGAYNQLELWSNDNRIEAGSKEDIYRALVRYRYNPKYADGAELSDIDSMTDEEIITFANTLSYYDRMDEGIEEEFDNVEDAKEYLRMIAESE